MISDATLVEQNKEIDEFSEQASKIFEFLIKFKKHLDLME